MIILLLKDGRNLSLLSLHPHNLGIQIWTETGLVGAVLASILLLSLIKPLKKNYNNSKSSSAYSGVIVASITISSLTIGAWQLWWWSAVFLALGITKLVNLTKQMRLLITFNLLRNYDSYYIYKYANI